MALISIIVPTKNRHAILSDHIRGVSKKIPASVEYLIYDNSDTALDPDIYIDSGCVYIHDPKKRSVGDNFSSALRHSASEYVAFIGDDDRVDLAKLETVASKLNADKSIDAIFSPIFDLIFLKGSGTKWTGVMQEDTIIVPNSLGRTLIRGIDLFSRTFGRFEKFWLLSPDLWNVPKGYFGMFKRSNLENLKSSDQRSIYLSPDAFMMGKLSNSKKILRIADPIFIPGTSAQSTSNLSNQRKHIGTITEQKHFDQFDLKKLPENTPNSFIPEVIWAGSFLAGKGLTRMDEEHVEFLRQYIRIKHHVDIKSQKEIANQPHFFMGQFKAIAAFAVNRLMVSVLIVARYKLSKRIHFSNSSFPRDMDIQFNH